MATNLNTGLNFGLNPGLRQSISGGVDSLGLFRSASLDLRFADKKTLTDRVSGDSLITFSRASGGTFVGSNGLIQTAGVNVPRFDHDPVTGESLGLLIEEGRTNKMLRSENLVNASNYWRCFNGATTTLSSVTAPDGVSNMWLVDLSDTPGTSSEGSRVVQGSLAFNNVVNTFSFYARSVSGTGTFPVAFFNGSNYVKSYVILTETTQRYEISCPSGISTTNNNIFGFSRRGLSHNETLTQAYIFGCQVEAAPYASSYISTDSSAVTRSPDICTIEGTSFSSWYNQSVGTIFVDSSGNPDKIVVISDGTDSNRHELFSTSTDVTLDQKNGGSSQVSLSQSRFSKAAFAYAADDYGLSVGGATAVTDTSATPPTVNKMSIGCQYDDSLQLNGHVSRLAYFPSRKADQKLAKMSS